MTDTYKTGVRQVIDDFLIAEAKKVRDYGEYSSASSAGYCYRKLIMQRMGVPQVKEDARKQRIFTAGHIFHDWIQGLTRKAGVSIAQEIELQDEELMVRGHFDDLVLVYDNPKHLEAEFGTSEQDGHLILYDYKTQNSRAFSYKRPLSHFHRLQLGTYMYMLRRLKTALEVDDEEGKKLIWGLTKDLSEARILKISKDDLRMSEDVLMWSEELERDVVNFWKGLNEAWKIAEESHKLPPCTCADYEGGFMAKEAYNPYWYGGEPCSIAWLQLCIREDKLIKKEA